MAATQQQAFKLRLPASLRAKIEESAEREGHSINSEIIRRLELSFRVDQMYEELQRKDRQLAETQERLNKVVDYTLALTAPKVRAPKVEREDAA
jgi:Arc-like DNA binding domain